MGVHTQIDWLTDIDVALSRARGSDRLVFADFNAAPA
jgi:hypothetical protein